ncbi:TPA: ATP-binding protein [Providencia alcalifaciens]|nr:ATP-binding protein [Providencia alcalifaciens]
MISTQSEVEKKAHKATDITIFKSISLANIKDKVAIILNQIGKNEIFDEYTKHDISHVDTMLDLVDTVVPEKTFQTLTSTECLMITLSIYFHDLGMLVTTKEYNNRESNANFISFKNSFLEKNIEIIKSLEKGKGKGKDKYIYQEYVRANHAKRVKDWINEENTLLNNFEEEVVKLIKEMLGDIPKSFKIDLANICESHNLNDLKDHSKYKVKQQYSSDKETLTNLHYCAIVLRVCDLLNITNDRAPSFEMRLISPENAISKIEWLKHNPVNVIRAKDKCDKDGKINPSLEKDTFEVLAYFKEETGFFNLMSYLEYTRKEIIECNNQCTFVNETFSLNYEFPWKNIDDSSIETEGFEREQLLFTIDQTKILDLLIGHTLYNDSSVVLRELIQNSIDACSLKEYKLKSEHSSYHYEGKIEIHVSDDNDEISIIDNGIGMSIDIIKNYLLKVGSSRYQEPEFKEKHKDFHSISRFGIGLLTCFMISDDIDIITKTKDSEKGLLIKIRKVHGKYLLKNIKENELPQEISDSGTKILLKPRYDARDQCVNLHESLKKWILIPKYEVSYTRQSETQKIGYKDTNEYLSSKINELGISSEDKIKVETLNRDGVEFSYAAKYNKYFKQWEFLQSDQFVNTDISGTCIEGIRIDYTSPGFNRNNMFSIANCTGKMAPKTNVARTNIENTEHKEIFLQKIYSILAEHIDNELNNLCKQFSISWASRESSFIISSLTPNSRNFMDDDYFLNEELFKNEIAKIKLILQEDHKQRKIISLNDLLAEGDFWTIDSISFHSADSLIKDVSSENNSASSLFIMNSIQGGEVAAKTDHINKLVCNIRGRNSDFISKYIIEKYSVKEIKTFTELRRIDLKWTPNQSEQLWSVLYHSNEYGKKSDVYIQNSDDIILDENSKGKVIKSSGFTFVLSGNPLHDLISGLDFTLRPDDEMSREHQFFNSMLGRIISDLFFISNKNHEDIGEYISRNIRQSERDRLEEMFYSYVNKDKFIDSIIRTDFVNLDVNTWRRSFS